MYIVKQKYIYRIIYRNHAYGTAYTISVWGTSVYNNQNIEYVNHNEARQYEKGYFNNLCKHCIG